MELGKVLYQVIMMVTIIFFPGLSIAQNLEVVGQAKITVMLTDNTADQIVVKQADGTLAVRAASTLTEYQILSISNDTIFLANGGFIKLPSEVDPTFTSSQAFNIDAADITNLNNLSGTNSGDQDLSGLATKAALGDSVAQVRSEIPDVSGFLTSEVDPTFTSSQAFNIDAADITNLNNLSGTNSGDQDLSGLATKTALGDSVALVRSEIPDIPTGTQMGEMQYWNGTDWVTVNPPVGNNKFLGFVNGIPRWVPIIGPTDVYNPTTGKVWMDRNLGALQVATSSNDAASYGDLYQWGRLTDGHEKRISSTSDTLSNSDTPSNGNFITTNSSPFDWRVPQNNNLWQGVGGVNNPCPSGYRLPTDAEWDAERMSWSSINAAGAMASPLKLPLAGGRNFSSGWLFSVGTIGTYWSSTVSGTTAGFLFFNSSVAFMNTSLRANGYSVRCLKD